MTTLFNSIFYVGSKLKGKWNGHRYQIQSVLGEGANGKVFLVKHSQGSYAMKVGLNSLDLQSEVNALRALSKTSAFFRKYVLDVDDISDQGKDFPFYVMPYVNGFHVKQFIRRFGEEWNDLIGLNYLKKLSEIHEHGWIFGDIKLENMLISGYGQVHLIDFGGMTQIGRSVKQFTEIYDRGYWNAGGRVAEPSYDLFSFAVLFLQMIDHQNLIHPKCPVIPQNRNVQYVWDVLKNYPRYKHLTPFFRKALTGRYRSTEEALEEWKALQMLPHKTKASNGDGSWLKIAFITSLIFFVSTVYYVWR